MWRKLDAESPQQDVSDSCDNTLPERILKQRLEFKFCPENFTARILKELDHFIKKAVQRNEHWNMCAYCALI